HHRARVDCPLEQAGVDLSNTNTGFAQRLAYRFRKSTTVVVELALLADVLRIESLCQSLGDNNDSHFSAARRLYGRLPVGRSNADRLRGSVCS
ncbi:MAG: hypothetical protein WCF41_10660, partial [Pseudolabrys sp.]